MLFPTLGIHALFRESETSSLSISFDHTGKTHRNKTCFNSDFGFAKLMRMVSVSCGVPMVII